MRGIDHVGLTVPDLDEAVDFLVTVAGAVEVLRHGPYPAQPATADQFGRHPQSAVAGIATLRLGSCNLELLQYETPHEGRVPPRPSDPGGHHVAFYVDDIDATVTRLRDIGVDVLGDPMDLPGPESGPGARFVFLRTPWGAILELVTFPHGKRCLEQEGPRPFDPRTIERERGA